MLPFLTPAMNHSKTAATRIPKPCIFTRLSKFPVIRSSKDHVPRKRRLPRSRGGTVNAAPGIRTPRLFILWASLIHGTMTMEGALFIKMKS
jgi:hypothetical protein